MKQRSSRKKRLKWVGTITGLIVLLIVVYLYLRSKRGGKKEKYDETAQQKQENKFDEGKGKRTSGKSEEDMISLSKYKDFLQSDEKGLGGRRIIDDTEECNKKYGLVELVFLKMKDGTLQPYIPGKEIRTGFRMYNRDLDCPAFGYGEVPGKFRYLVKVYKTCVRDCYGAKPGYSYRLESYAHHRDLKYMIKIPPAEELVFQTDFDPDSFEGTTEDPVHRIPILIDDVLATKEPRARVEQIWTSKDLTISGIPHINGAGKERHLNVGYYFRDTRHSTSEKTASKKIELEVKTKTKDNVSGMTGGLLVIYGTPVDPEHTTYTRLLGYIPEVQSNPVSFSKNSTLKYQPGKWVRKRINIGSTIEKNRPKILEKIKEENKRREGIFLEHQKKEYRKKVYICIGQLKEKEDGFYTTLEAPPGTYRLKYGNTHLIKENFTWPPKN